MQLGIFCHTAFPFKATLGCIKIVMSETISNYRQAIM